MTAVQHLFVWTAPTSIASEPGWIALTEYYLHLRFLFSAFSILRAMVWTMFLKMHVYVNVFFPLTGITSTVKVLLHSTVGVIDMNVG